MTSVWTNSTKVWVAATLVRDSQIRETGRGGALERKREMSGLSIPTASKTQI